MASEDIGSIYNTQIPGYEDSADIQAALKLYHYGTLSPVTTEAQIVQNSVVGHIKALDTRVESVEASGFGSDFSSNIPTDPIDGFIWVDSNSSFGTVSGSVVAYQDDAPATGLVDGLLWVDKNSSPLKMYVYDITDAEWKEIGV